MKTPEVTVVGVWNNDHGHYKDEWFHESCAAFAAQTAKPDDWLIVFFGRKVPQGISRYGFTAVHRPDLNYTEARAAGMDMVDTTWACVMDLDDIYEPTLIEKKLAYIAEHPDVVMISSWYRFMDEEGGLLAHVMDGQRIEERMKNGPGPPSEKMAHPGIFLRMDAYRKSGGYNPELEHKPRPRQAAGEDRDLWPRIAEHGDWAVIPEFLWTYRRHAGQQVQRPYKGEA